MCIKKICSNLSSWKGHLLNPTYNNIFYFLKESFVYLPTGAAIVVFQRTAMTLKIDLFQ